MAEQKTLFLTSEFETTNKGTSFHGFQDEKKFKSNDSDIDEANSGCCSEGSRKTWIGFVIVIFLAIAWVGAQQFAQSAVTSENFLAPFFTTWFGTCWMILCFPVYGLLLFPFLHKKEFRLKLLNSLKIFGPKKIVFSEIFTKVFPFNVLWIVTNYLYTFSLTYIAATDASAIISSNVAIVYILSFFLLGELFYFTRFIASLFCISGVVLFAYADGFEGGDNLLPGILMAIFSAIGSAVYKVSFKRVLGEGKLGQVSLFLSLLGLTNALFLWIIFLILYLTGVEAISGSDIPWSFLCGSSSLSLVFNFLVNFGVAVTYPLFISVAMMLGIPLNAAIDLLIRNEVFSVLRLVASLLVIAGFALMMCPDSWNLPFHRPFGVKSSRCYGSNNDQDKEDSIPINDQPHLVQMEKL